VVALASDNNWRSLIGIAHALLWISRASDRKEFVTQAVHSTIAAAMDEPQAIAATTRPTKQTVTRLAPAAQKSEKLTVD